MQVKALSEAAAELIKAGKSPRPEVMIPLTATVQEFEIMHDRADEVFAEVEAEYGVTLDIPVGTMIEVPRAALTAGEIAEQAEFFSFGTNDLTQMTWAFSRDDVEGEFFGRYIELGIFGVSPFESIDAGRRRPTRPDRHRGRQGRQPRPRGRGVRGARRRPGVDPLLRRGRGRLRVLLAVPGAGRPARGRPRVARHRGERHPLGASPSRPHP
jgi:hypothetical protein